MSKDYINRYPPCPPYEIRRFEGWLEDMARNGWLLLRDPFSRFGYATFRKIEPREVRFRLQAAPKAPGRFSRRDRQQEAVNLATEYGWAYVGMHEDFLIYYTDDPDLPELDTDPQVQIMALEEHRKRRQKKFRIGLIVIALFFGLFLWVGPISLTLNQPIWYLPLLLLFVVGYILLHLIELAHLKRRKQELDLRDPSAEQNHKHTPINIHNTITLALTVLHLLFLATIIGNSFFHWQYFRWQFVSRYEEPLPFATMEDIAGGGTLDTSSWSVDHNNELAVRTALFASTQIQFVQYGEVFQDEEKVVAGALQIDYYELRSEWLAKQLFREIHHGATLSRGTYSQYIANDTPELPVDQAAAYTNYYPTLLLRQGTKVLRVRFNQNSRDVRIPLEQWAAVFAESILD